MTGQYSGKEETRQGKDSSDREQRDPVILANLGLVHAMAHRLKGRGVG